MSEMCKHGVRNTATNLPYCRRCDDEAKSSFVPAPGYAALIEHIKTLRRMIIEHHSSNVMREEICECPVCTEKENASVLDASHKLTAQHSVEVCDGGRKTSELKKDANRHSQN